MTSCDDAARRPLLARLHGLDLARGLAVIGMIAAHVAVISYTDPDTFTRVPFDLRDPRTWGDVVNGRSSTAFAVLAGVSVALVTGGRRPSQGIELVRGRLRLMVRAALIFAIGGLLELLDPPLGVILPVYGVLFVVSIGFLTWSSRALFALAGGLALAMPVVQLVLSQVVLHQEASGGMGSGQSTFPHLLVAGAYPVTTFLIYLLVGMGIGRMNLTATAVQIRLLVAGASMALAGYGVGSLVHAAAGHDEALFGPLSPRERALIVDGLADEAVPTVIWDFKSLLTTAPHTGSWFDVVGSCGVAVLLIALCLALPAAAYRALYPVAAVGSMALTSYTVQVVAISVRGDVEDLTPTNTYFFQLTGAVLVLATIWRLTLGAGPLERVVTYVSRAAARVDAPDTARRAGRRTSARQPGAGPTPGPSEALGAEPTTGSHSV